MAQFCCIPPPAPSDDDAPGSSSLGVSGGDPGSSAVDEDGDLLDSPLWWRMAEAAWWSVGEEGMTEGWCRCSCCWWCCGAGGRSCCWCKCGGCGGVSGVRVAAAEGGSILRAESGTGGGVAWIISLMAGERDRLADAGRQAYFRERKSSSLLLKNSPCRAAALD